MNASVRRVAQIKLLIGITIPFVAYAGEQVVHRTQDQVNGISLWLWFFIWLFSSAGWAIVHLDSLAEWMSSITAPTRAETVSLWKARLKLIKNYIASVSAGVAFYFLAKSVPYWFGMPSELPEMLIFVGVVPAAMSGTALWEKIRARFPLG